MRASLLSRLSRETRLLLIVITLSAAVLMVLSRFRFPEQQQGEPAVTAPLERLAARATYDELANIIAELGNRITPSVTVLRAETDGQQRFIPAVRVRPDLVLAHITGTSRITGAVGDRAPVDVAVFDAARELVLVRVAADASRVISLRSLAARASAPRYVAAVEGTRGGPTLRPVFLGRTDPLRNERYGDLLVLGGVLQATPGSLVFGLDGSFVALCIMEEGFVAGIPGAALEAAVDAMLAVPSR